MGLLDLLFGPEKRTCRRCGERLPLERFPPKHDKARPGARKYICKRCDNRRTRENRKRRRRVRSGGW